MDEPKMIIEYHTGYFCKEKYTEKLIITKSYISYKKTWHFFDLDYLLDEIHNTFEKNKADIYWKKNFSSHRYRSEYYEIVHDIDEAIQNRIRNIEVCDGDGLTVVHIEEGHKILDDYFCPSADQKTIKKIKEILYPYIGEMPYPQFWYNGISSGVYISPDKSEIVL